MALQSSGPISIDDIRTELSSSSGSLRTLSAAAGKSTPDAMSEFYGYSNVDFTSSMTVGSWFIINANYYGYSSFNGGSMTNTSFNSGTIDSLYWRSTSGGELWFLNNQKSFSNITINGNTFPASTNWTLIGGGWRYITTTNPFGTSGTITITANY